MGLAPVGVDTVLRDGRGLTGCDVQAEGHLFRTLGVDADKLARDGVVAPGSKELVSVGPPLAGVDVEIRDSAGMPLPPGQVGRIFVRGASVMAGYFGRTDLTDQAIHDGWLDSGDLGFTHYGELFVCGRHKDIIVVRGANHAPEEFEAALESLPGVRTGCAVAVGFVPAGQDDEALAMLVETTSDAPSTLADDVASRVQERTQIRPAHVELWHRARCRVPAAESCDGVRPAPSGWQAR